MIVENVFAYLRAAAILAAFAMTALLFLWVVGGLSDVASFAIFTMYCVMSLPFVIAGWRVGFTTTAISISVFVLVGALLFFTLNFAASWLAANLGSGGFLMRLVS